MTHPLDHLLWATPDLAAGTGHIAERLGVTPAIGGTHPGFGTRNALLSLGETYLEIIAPDPAQDLSGTRGAHIATLREPGLLTFAVRSFDLARTEQLVSGAGLTTPGPVAMSRRHPDGHLLEWRILRLDETPWGDYLPFFIDWGDTPHPARTTPGGCELLDFRVHHPDEALADLYRALDLGMSVSPSRVARFEAALQTPGGRVDLR